MDLYSDDGATCFVVARLADGSEVTRPALLSLCENDDNYSGDLIGLQVALTTQNDVGVVALNGVGLVDESAIVIGIGHAPTDDEPTTYEPTTYEPTNDDDGPWGQPSPSP